MIDDRDGEIEGNAEGLQPAKSAKGLGLQWVADSNIPADQLATSASFFFLVKLIFPEMKLFASKNSVLY